MRAPVTTRPARCLDESSRPFWLPLVLIVGVLSSYCWLVEIFTN